MAPKYIAPEQIEDIANTTRQLSGADSDVLEVDVLKIAERLGVAVEVVDFEDQNVYAQLLRHGAPGADFTIQVARADGPRRRRFSIAHELAHSVLHADGDEDHFVEYRQELGRYNPDQLYKEVQANMFASALLLPKDKVMLMWESTRDIDRVAQAFAVSKEAAFLRIRNLGLLPNE
jgi:Zn-dependent peptidase ImmA (M78 family)